jgi:hypothetical protein
VGCDMRLESGERYQLMKVVIISCLTVNGWIKSYFGSEANFVSD